MFRVYSNLYLLKNWNRKKNRIPYIYFVNSWYMLLHLKKKDKKREKKLKNIDFWLHLCLQSYFDILNSDQTCVSYHIKACLKQALCFFEMYVLFGYCGVTKGMERKWINLPESFLFLKKSNKKKSYKNRSYYESKYIKSRYIYCKFWLYIKFLCIISFEDNSFILWMTST